MRKIGKISAGTIITIVLVLLAALCMAGTAFGKDQETDRERQQYYLETERDYRKEICGFLEEKGYRNSGVTVNRIWDENGELSYQVTIHHGKIEKLDAEEKQALLEECGQIPMGEEGCRIRVQYLS